MVIITVPETPKKQHLYLQNVCKVNLRPCSGAEDEGTQDSICILARYYTAAGKHDKGLVRISTAPWRYGLFTSGEDLTASYLGVFSLGCLARVRYQSNLREPRPLVKKDASWLPRYCVCALKHLVELLHVSGKPVAGWTRLSRFVQQCIAVSKEEPYDPKGPRKCQWCGQEVLWLFPQVYGHSPVGPSG
jgi:hypothetical protein